MLEHGILLRYHQFSKCLYICPQLIKGMQLLQTNCYEKQPEGDRKSGHKSLTSTQNEIYKEILKS